MPEGIEDYYLKKYITDGESIYGYVTGIYLVNRLNLIPQVPYTRVHSYGDSIAIFNETSYMCFARDKSRRLQ